MKSILIKFLIIISFFIFWTWSTFATSSESWWIIVKVSEKIPWAECSELYEDENDTELVTWYECNVWKWFTAVTIMLWKIIKYFTYIAALGWVLFIVINWILYSMWWVNDEFKSKSKERIIWTLIWLVLLMLSWVILNMIAPWIYK